MASLDPAFAKNQSIMWVVYQLYNTLVEIDSNLNIVPSLAKNWEISDDRSEYIFHLRTDVYFQDNEVFENGNYPDAENYMAMFYSRNPSPPNYTRYNNTSLMIYTKRPCGK